MTTIDHQQAAIDQVAEILHDCFGCSPGGEASPGCECDPEPYESDAEHILAAATPHLRAGIVKEAYERLFDIVYDKEAAEYEGPEQIHPATITFKLYEFEHVLALLEGGGE